MSRLGKKPIHIPEKTEVTVHDGRVTVKGPLGELSREFRPDIKISVKDNEIHVAPKTLTNFYNALWGTYSAHLKNMVDGVNRVFEKKLIIEGIGYRVQSSGSKLVLHIGFSHPVEIEIPQGVQVSVEKNFITVSGVNKESVGQFAAHVRSLKKPEPYKGKGIRYENEVVRRKQGKKAA